ncbi:MAG: methionyl-tRNA formyltransferase [Candidatus Saccharimonadales bacterium]
MKASKKILFFGNERLATGVVTDTPIIKALVSNGYEIVAAVTTSLRANPSRKLRESEINTVAAKFDIPLIQLDRLKPALEQLKEFNAIAGILASFGKMVPSEIIDIFPFGIINVHPSLLPAHRGPTPIESAILNGDSLTGVSLMKLVSEMDAGPIFDQVEVPLQGNESKQDLADSLGKLGAERLIAVLPQILSGQLKPLAQTGSVTYDKRLESSLGTLDLNLPANRLEREIRAYKGWPRSRCEINNQMIIITQAHVGPSSYGSVGKIRDDNGTLVATTRDGDLIIDRLIPAGGKEMSSQDYLRGRPS